MTLTTSDRHTGRAARRAAVPQKDRATERPAGSRDEERRSPLEGGGGGSQPPLRPAKAGGGPGPIFGSYPRNNCPKGRQFTTSERRRWLGALEQSTWPFRTRRSRANHTKAMEALQEGERFKYAWYQARARGQRQRFDVVHACGDNEVVIRCEDCGHSGRRATAFCDQWRLCLGCRSRRGIEYRKRFRDGRVRALARLAHLMRRGAKGGEWTEKFLTLTLPHSGDVVRDLKVLPTAWRWFWKRLREHLEHDRGVCAANIRKLAYVRVIEVTAGTRSDGHAHLHVYLICPYLHHEVVGMLWGRAIAREGYKTTSKAISEVLGEEMPEWRRTQLCRFLVTRRGGRLLDSVPNPVDHIQTCYGDIENELVKYLVKDAVKGPGGETHLVDVDFYAKAYEGMEGLQTVRTSSGFWVKRQSKACRCEKCGSEALSRRIEKAKPADDGPPVWSEMDRPPAEWASNDD